MSQKKVDKYKEQKANRKKIMRKEKILSICRYVVLTVVVVALVGWLGYSVYNKYQSDIPRKMASVNYTAITDYMSSLANTEEKTGEGEDQTTEEAAQ